MSLAAITQNERSWNQNCIEQDYLCIDLQQNNNCEIVILEKLKINQTYVLEKKIKITLNKIYWGSTSKTTLSFFLS